jgi:hypothetical protein
MEVMVAGVDGSRNPLAVKPFRVPLLNLLKKLNKNHGFSFFISAPV